MNPLNFVFLRNEIYPLIFANIIESMWMKIYDKYHNAQCDMCP